MWKDEHLKKEKRVDYKNWSRLEATADSGGVTQSLENRASHLLVAIRVAIL